MSTHSQHISPLSDFSNKFFLQLMHSDAQVSWDRLMSAEKKLMSVVDKEEVHVVKLDFHEKISDLFTAKTIVGIENKQENGKHTITALEDISVNDPISLQQHYKDEQNKVQDGRYISGIVLSKQYIDLSSYFYQYQRELHNKRRETLQFLKELQYQAQHKQGDELQLEFLGRYKHLNEDILAKYDKNIGYDTYLKKFNKYSFYQIEIASPLHHLKGKKTNSMYFDNKEEVQQNAVAIIKEICKDLTNLTINTDNVTEAQLPKISNYAVCGVFDKWDAIKELAAKSQLAFFLGHDKGGKNTLYLTDKAQYEKISDPIHKCIHPALFDESNKNFFMDVTLNEQVHNINTKKVIVSYADTDNDEFKPTQNQDTAEADYIKDPCSIDSQVLTHQHQKVQDSKDNQIVMPIPRIMCNKGFAPDIKVGYIATLGDSFDKEIYKQTEYLISETTIVFDVLEEYVQSCIGIDTSCIPMPQISEEKRVEQTYYAQITTKDGAAKGDEVEMYQKKYVPINLIGWEDGKNKSMAALSYQNSAVHTIPMPGTLIKVSIDTTKGLEHVPEVQSTIYNNDKFWKTFWQKEEHESLSHLALIKYNPAADNAKPDECNYIVFANEKDKQEVNVHAAKNYVEKTVDTKTVIVGNTQIEDIKDTIKDNKLVIHITGDILKTINGKIQVNVDKDNLILNVTPDGCDIKAKIPVKVESEKDIKLHSDTKVTISSKGDIAVACDGKFDVNAKGGCINKTNGKIDLNAQQGIVMSSTSQNIEMSALKITVNAKTQLDMSGMNIDIAGKVQASMSAPMIEVAGKGMSTIKGALLMLKN